MKKKLLISFLAISSLINAEESISQNKSHETIVEKKDSILDGYFSTYGFGGSKITLGDDYHKALMISSKSGYKFDNDISIYILGESSYYRYLGDIKEMGITGVGIGYDIPYTENKLTVSAVAGVGISFNYNEMFRKFSQSYDFGFAYRADVSYQFTDNFNMNISYSQFDFNTNATHLEDTKPNIIGLNFVYKFDLATFLK